MEEAADRIRDILEAKYEAANLRDICDKFMHLDAEKQEQLFQLLNKYETLFDGKLGQWEAWLPIPAGIPDSGFRNSDSGAFESGFRNSGR
jgi:hypothetical protein